MSQERKPRILVVGSFVMDLIVTAERFPGSGETVVGLNYQTAPGGKGANQAVQAARLGADVTMVGKVGQDAFGEELIASAKVSGVDVSHVLRTAETHTAIGNVQLEVGEGKGVNRIIVVQGANMKITPEDVAFLEDEIGNYDMVMLQLEIPMEVNCLVAAYASAKGVPVMMNCAPMEPMPEELLKNVTYISPNEHEAHILTGIEVTDMDSAKAAMEKIHSLGVKQALITLGSKGVVYSDGDEFLFSPAVEGLDVKDTTAAGDSFMGAFCTAIAAGSAVADALAFANHTAAITVCRMGAQPSLPMRDEVARLMSLKRA